MIIDSHCHLTYEPMSKALDQTINRAIKDGIKFMLTISTEDKSFEKIGPTFPLLILIPPSEVTGSMQKGVPVMKASSAV